MKQLIHTTIEGIDIDKLPLTIRFIGPIEMWRILSAGEDKTYHVWYMDIPSWDLRSAIQHGIKHIDEANLYMPEPCKDMYIEITQTCAGWLANANYLKQQHMWVDIATQISEHVGYVADMYKSK